MLLLAFIISCYLPLLFIIVEMLNKTIQKQLNITICLQVKVIHMARENEINESIEQDDVQAKFPYLKLKKSKLILCHIILNYTKLLSFE